MTERYEIISLISKDQAGGIYLAQDSVLERKVVLRHIDAGGNEEVLQSDIWREEFTEFSGKLCALQHPNLTTIYDVTIDEDGANMVSQHIEGESLAERLKAGALRELGVYRMASDMLEAMHAAHASGVFHGALHTGSVKRLPRATGGHRYIIIDLGLNRLATMVRGEDVNIIDPVLLAPELHEEGVKPDARADLFMLGQLCYTALAGGHPFAEYGPDRCAGAHLAGELPPLSDYIKVQDDLAGWVMSLCGGDRSQRPDSIEEAMKSLQEISIDEPVPNVPGETHAIQETPKQVTASQELSSEGMVVAVDAGAVERRSQRRILGTIVSLCAVILLGLVLVLSRGGDNESGNAPGSALSEALDEVPVRLYDTEILNTMEKRTEPVVIDWRPAEALDWTITTGAPASSKRMDKEEGIYIQSIASVGDFKEFAFTKNPIRLSLDEKEIMPRAATDFKRGAKVGDGWEVMLRMPRKHEGSVLLTLYMIQWHCGFNVEVALPDGEETMKFSVPSTDPGVVKIPLEITDPKGGEFYTVKVTSTSSHPKEGFVMGVSAIRVEAR